jgi:hypothetical protein
MFQTEVVEINEAYTELITTLSPVTTQEWLTQML